MSLTPAFTTSMTCLEALPLPVPADMEDIPNLPSRRSVIAGSKLLDSKYQFEQKLPFHPNSDFIRVYVAKIVLTPHSNR